MSVYAWVHTACGHLSSNHRLTQDAPSIEGPYACLLCACRMQQSDPQHGLTRDEYDRLQDRAVGGTEEETK